MLDTVYSENKYNGADHSPGSPQDGKNQENTLKSVAMPGQPGSGPFSAVIFKIAEEVVKGYKPENREQGKETVTNGVEFKPF